jgi:hypothetical protein
VGIGIRGRYGVAFGGDRGGRVSDALMISVFFEEEEGPTAWPVEFGHEQLDHVVKRAVERRMRGK